MAPSALAADALTWSSVQGLFPGPKPRQWVLSPSDIAPWSSQAILPRTLAERIVGNERTWKYQGQSALVVAVQMPLVAGCEAGPRGFVVGVLDSNRALIARSAELFSEEADGAQANGTGLLYQIDTAPYRISDTDTAFGVRIVHYHQARFWCFADQVLHLFRVVGKNVVRILAADAFYQQNDIDSENDQAVGYDPECSFSEGRPFPPKGRGAVFRMLPTQTNGFYDIQRTLKGGPTVTFRWDGQRYGMEGKDPVDHRMREEWDWWATGSLCRPKTPKPGKQDAAAKTPTTPTQSPTKP